MNTKQNGVHVTLSERFRIKALLDLHLKPRGDGAFVYDKGWDDLTIATAVRDGLKAHSVAFVRIQMFGLVRPINKAAPDKEVAEASPTGIEQRVRERIDHFAKTMNGLVAAVRNDLSATHQKIGELNHLVDTLYERLGEPKP